VFIHLEHTKDEQYHSRVATPQINNESKRKNKLCQFKPNLPLR
jgi:hypothetical protein